MEDNKNYYMESTPENNGVVDIDIKSYLDKPQKQANVGTYKVGRYDAGIYAAPSVNANVGMLFDDNSRYDSRIQSVNDVISGEKTINNLRGEVQTGFEKVASGILKGGVLAGTTFVDSLLGLPVGLLNVIDGGEDGIPQFSDFWGNPLTTGLQKVNEWSEKVLPNYYTKEEEEKPWYQKVFTANFIGDAVLKNAGFFVGAAVGGRVNAGVLSRMAGMNKARDVFKGILAQSNLDDLTQSQIYDKVVKGAYNFKEGALLDDLAASARQVSNQSNMMKLTGALTAGMGEARIQAVSNANATRDIMNQQLEEELASWAQGERDNMPAEYKTLNRGADGRYSIGLTPEGESILQQRILEKREAGMANTEKALAKIGNVEFALNTALLSASDWVQFGKYYAGGFKNASKAKAAIGGTVGQYTAKGNKLKTALNIAKSPFVEGNEEMMQEAAAVASKNLYTQESLLDSQGDPVAISQTNGFIKSLAKGIVDTYRDIDQWENFAVGALIGFGAIPTFTKTEEGKRSVSFQGGIWDSVKELKQNREQSETLASAMNQIIEDDNKALFMNNLYRQTAEENKKEGALERNDNFDYKNSEANQLISNIITFDQAGRLQDLKDWATSFAEVNTQEEIDNIRANTVNKETGKSIYDDMSDDEIKQSLKNQADEVNTMIDAYAEISSDLQLLTGKSKNSEELQELTWQALRIDDMEKRFKSIWGEVQDGVKQFEAEFKDQTVTIDGQQVPLMEVINTSPGDFLVHALPNVASSMLTAEQAYATNVERLKEQEAKVVANQDGRGLKKMQERLSGIQALVDASEQPALKAKDLHTKIGDLSRILSQRASFVKNYNEYLTQPEKLEQHVQKVKENNEKKQQDFEKGAQDKKNSLIKEELNNTQSVEEFKNLLHSFNEEGKSIDDNRANQERIADEMSKADHPVAMAYMDIQNTYKSLVETITNDYATLEDHAGVRENSDQDIADAVHVLNRMLNVVQDASELRSSNSQALQGMQMAYDENNPGVPDLTMGRLEAAKILVGRAIDAVNNVNSKHKAAAITFTADESATKEVEAPKVQDTPVDPSDSINETLFTTVLEDNSSNNPAIVGSRETELTQEEAKQGVQYRYWKPAFSEHHTPSLEQGEVVSYTVGEKAPHLQDIYDVLNTPDPKTGESAFSYVNKGKLQKGDDIEFRVVPEVNKKEGIKGFTPILIYSGEQIIGVLPEKGAAKHARLAETLSNIKNEYQKFLEQDESNKDKIFTSKIKTQVSGVLPGRLVFSKTENDLKNVVKNTPTPQFSFVKQGLFQSPNVNDDHLDAQLKSTASREGSLYIRAKGADGRYYPVAVRVKHFNPREFNLDDVNTQSSGRYKNIQEALNTIYTGSRENNKDLINQGVAKLQENLYLPHSIVVRESTSKTGEKKINIDYGIPKNDQQDRIELFHISSTVETGAAPQAVLASFGLDGDQIAPQPATGQKQVIAQEQVVKDLMRKLQNHNIRFQVQGSRLNSPGYNESLVADNILTTNWVSPDIHSAWFQMAPVGADGTVFTPEQMGIAPTAVVKAPAPVSKTAVNGVETISKVATTVTYEGVTYDVDSSGKVISDINKFLRDKVEDLAYIKLNKDKIEIVGDYFKIPRSPNSVYIHRKTLDYAGVPEVKKLEAGIKEEKKQKQKETLQDSVAKRIAIGAGLVVNPNFVGETKKTEAPKVSSLDEMIEYNSMLQHFPAYMRSKAFTQQTWEQLTREEKKDQLDCASISS